MGQSFPHQFSASRNKTVVGLRLGGGLEQLITQSVSLQVSYVYTLYPKIETNLAEGVRIINVMPDAFSADYSAKPSKQNLAYYF